MFTRTVAAVLWYFVVGWGWNLFAAIAGLPSGMGPVIGLVAAAFILLAPLRAIPSFAMRSRARPALDLGRAPGGLPDLR